jgi:Flp pilus assembly secretin CpaC
MRFSHFALLLLLALVSTGGVKALNQSPLTGNTDTTREAIQASSAQLLKTHLKTALTTPRRLADVDISLSSQLPRHIARLGSPAVRQSLHRLHNPFTAGNTLALVTDEPIAVQPLVTPKSQAATMPSQETPSKPSPLTPLVQSAPVQANVNSSKSPAAAPSKPAVFTHTQPDDDDTPNALPPIANAKTSQTATHHTSTVKPLDDKTLDALKTIANPLTANAFLAAGPVPEATKPVSHKAVEGTIEGRLHHHPALPKMPLTEAQAADADRKTLDALKATHQQTDTPKNVVSAQPSSAHPIPSTQSPSHRYGSHPVFKRQLVLGGESTILNAHPANRIKLPRLSLSPGQINRLVSQANNPVSMLGYAAPPLPNGPYIALRPPHAETRVLRSGISNDKTLDLVVGKSRVINLPFSVARVAISNPNVAQALVISPTQLQLVGKQPGLTNLTLWNSLYDNNPLSYDLSVIRDVSQLAKQLKRIDPNISISALAADNAVILTGEVDSPEVAQTAVDVAKAYFGNGSTTPSVGASQGGGASAGGAAPGSGQAAGGSSAGAGSSLSLGSSVPVGQSPNVVNMLKVKGRPSSKMALVQEKLKAIDPNIQMDIVPGPGGAEKVILTGRVRSASMVSRAINTASIFYGQPGLKVITGPGGNAVHSTSDGNFQADSAFSNNMDVNILQGSVVTDASGNVVSMMQVTEKPQIRCSIKILDISRKDLNQLGATFSMGSRNLSGASLSGSQSANRSFMDLNPDRSGNGIAGGSGTSGSSSNLVNAVTQTYRNGLTQVFTINQSFNAALSAFIEKRNIKTLAEPTLTMMSGEKASFLAGGEIPVPVSAMNGQISVQFKEFGIRLNLIPTLQENGKIHMQVAPEVSEVDPSISVSTSNVSIPGFRKRRMQTTLELDNQQTFVLAGLFNKSSLDVLSKFPGMGNLPVVGSLFRQKNGERSDNEMVVIIQPQVIMTANDGR